MVLGRLGFGFEFERAGFDFVTNSRQTVTDRRHIDVRQNADFAQHSGMRDRSGDVLRIERLVKADGSINSFHKCVGRSGEPSTPHLVGPAARGIRAIGIICIAHVYVRFSVRFAIRD